MHIYVEIYGHRIPTYGLLITIGVILANLIAIICMKRKYKKDCIEDFLIVEAYTMAGAFLEQNVCTCWLAIEILTGKISLILNISILLCKADLYFMED